MSYKTLAHDPDRCELLMHAVSAVAMFTEATLTELPAANRAFINEAMEAHVPLSITFELKAGGVTVSASLHTTELTPLFFVSVPPPEKKEESHIFN